MKKNLKDYTSFKFSIDSVIQEARLRCMKEMYAKAQPSANYDDILAYYEDCRKKGIEPERVFDRYYLSWEEFDYIRNKYIEAYHFKNQFRDDCNLIIRDMKEGCMKDGYVPTMMDKKGEFHQGYSRCVDVKPLAKLIGKKDAGKAIKFIAERRDFYKFDKVEEQFSLLISMGDSPCSNAELVKKYWKSQGVDLEIDPRHYTHDDFWCEDNGYIDEEDE